MGVGVFAKKPKPSGGGSVLGAPSQTAVECYAGRFCGAGDDEIAVVGVPVW